MKIAMYSTKAHDRRFFEIANSSHQHGLVFLEPRLSVETAPLAAGFEAVCAFVNDSLDATVLGVLARGGTTLIALRSAGYNHIDLRAAAALGMRVVRVPAYSPYAVAEHAVGMILTLNRKLHRAYNRVREGNFALDGLLGFDVHGKTVGIVGTGAIGGVFVRIMSGFGCELLAFDPKPNLALESLGVRYTTLEELLRRADIVSLHCPLTPKTHHLIDAETLGLMKPGMMLINTSRGALVDTRAVIEALKTGQIGLLGLDVYEEEADLFFENLSDQVIQDDVFSRLLTFPNVLITGHQGFYTAEALANIAETTLTNVSSVARGRGALHEVTLQRNPGSSSEA